MRHHMHLAIKAVATAAAVIAATACGSDSSSGGSSGGAGPVSGHSLSITATGSSTAGGHTSPYSTAPNMGGSMAAGGTSHARTNPYFFTPTPDTVAVGSTVTWMFQDVNHTVTFDTPGAPADISSLAAGGVANADSSRVFATAGTFNYHCSIHTFMTGTVVVQ
jgi:plastocyanin